MERRLDLGFGTGLPALQTLRVDACGNHTEVPEDLRDALPALRSVMLTGLLKIEGTEDLPAGLEELALTAFVDISDYHII